MSVLFYSKRFKLCLSAALMGSLSLSSVLIAQVFTPPSQKPASSSNNNSTTTVKSQSGGGGSKQMLGNDVPFFDPGSETFSFDGKNWNVNNNRVFAARFEKYLNAPPSESEQDKAYRAVMREVLDALSPHRKPNLPKAVALLEGASKFEQDARLCESLANAVYRVWLAKKSVGDLKRINQELKKQRKQLDWKFEQWNEPTALQPASKDGKNKSKPVTVANAGQVQRFIQRITEVEASRVKNMAKMELSQIQAKLEFQALILQFFMQRRFEHVIMAARIYTEFFRDGNGKLDFEKGSDIEKSFSQSLGFSPTVTTLDSFANEAIRDVNEAVQAFDFLIEKGNLDGASKRLAEAFLSGEYMPKVRTLPMEKKQKVAEYSRMSFQLISTLQIRDYTLAEELVKKMRAAAQDFDYSKPLQAIEVAKITSNMRIRTAKNAALKGQNEVYEENIKAAAEIWPTNPVLKEQFNLIADQGDVMQQAKLEFDRLISTQSYRQIYNDKGRFIAATVDDAGRQEALTEILTNIQEIEISLKQAEALAKGGNPYGAWEIVERVFKRFPDDQPLGTQRSNLATEVAEFVGALKKAENLEQRNQAGSSLAWYLKSRKMYPNSIFAQEGIGRLVESILPDQEGEEQ
ncbi:MAG: hypothetical protein L3J39_14980 [Verrucomicrobiales bacterium]|nr:hypothetical protein [Verrucomicrobiales bacterium]